MNGGGARGSRLFHAAIGGSARLWHAGRRTPNRRLAMSSPINPFLDLQTLMTQFSVPGVDLAAVIESRRKDIDALVAANQSAIEAAQALGRKQTEMLTQAMQDIQQAARDTASGVGLGDPAKQQANARKAIEKAIGD